MRKGEQYICTKCEFQERTRKFKKNQIEILDLKNTVTEVKKINEEVQ